jgi:adenylate cyclase
VTGPSAAPGAGSGAASRREWLRIQIAVKIFGIALALLVLLATVAWISTRNVERVRQELLEVSDFFTPLTYLASSMEIHQLEQAVQIERALGAAAAGTPGPVRAALAEIGRQGQLIDERIAQSMQLVQEGSARATSRADVAEFAALGAQLHAIEREHHGFETRAVQAIEALLAGAPLPATLRADLEREEREFVDELNATRKQLQAFSQASAAEAAAHQARILRLNIVVTAAAIVSGLLFAAIITSGLVQPIRRLVKGTLDVERGDLDTHVPVTSRDEIGALTESFNRMTEQLRLKERIKQTFGTYVDPRVVERLLEQTAGAAGAGERQRVTVAFTDIRGFTPLAENLTPPVLVQVINRYFTLMAEPIVRHGGVVDKFIGDAVMAFWSPPFVSAEDHPASACLAALEQQAQLEQLRRELPDLVGFRKGVPEIGVRIGLATGDAVVGSIGSDRVKGFTVMGDTVNVASRLEGIGRIYGTSILMSEETRQLAGAAIETREIDCIRAPGKQDPVRIYELLAAAGGLDEATARLRDSFELGLAAYRAKDLASARSYFETCLAIRPGDRPSEVFLERLQRLSAEPLPAGWDGVWTLTK